MSDITRYRADDYPVRVNLSSGGVPLDITGCSFILTVNAEEKPDDASEEIFSVSGTIVAPASGGVVEFDPPGTTEPGRYFYDVEMTDSLGRVKTVEYNDYVILQDITKSDEVFEWTPPEEPNDGDPATVDGTEHWFASEWTPVLATYETRDGRRVIRDESKSTSAWDGSVWQAKGPAFSRQSFQLPGWEWQVTFYADKFQMSLELQDGLYWMAFWNILNLRAGVVDFGNTGGYLWDPAVGGADYITDKITLPGTAGWPTAGWYVFGLRVNPDWSFEYQIRPEANDEDWRTMTTGNYIWPPANALVLPPYMYSYPVNPEDLTSRFEIWKYEWRKL